MAKQIGKDIGPLNGMDQRCTSTMRSPPLGDHQADFFIPHLCDVGTRDGRNVMDVAICRLSKRNNRSNCLIRYDLSDGFIEVRSGPAGMATIWDYDLVLMAISHLTESMNRYRKEGGEFPSRVFHPHISDILKFCRRNGGGKQRKSLLDALLRLNTTHIAIERRKKKGGETYIVSEGEPLISRYRVVSNESSGKPESVEIEVPNWIYEEVTQGTTPDVLTVHHNYFLIDSGVGRFLYRLARRAAGKTDARYLFKTLYERSGSTGDLKKFTFSLRKLINEDSLPEYMLSEEKGANGPVLVMTHRAYYAEVHDLSPQEYTSMLLEAGMNISESAQEGRRYAKQLRQKRTQNSSGS